MPTRTTPVDQMTKLVQRVVRVHPVTRKNDQTSCEDLLISSERRASKLPCFASGVSSFLHMFHTQNELNFSVQILNFFSIKKQSCCKVVLVSFGPVLSTFQAFCHFEKQALKD